MVRRPLSEDGLFVTKPLKDADLDRRPGNGSDAILFPAGRLDSISYTDITCDVCWLKTGNAGSCD